MIKYRQKEPPLGLTKLGGAFASEIAPVTVSIGAFIRREAVGFEEKRDDDLLDGVADLLDGVADLLEKSDVAFSLACL